MRATGLIRGEGETSPGPSEGGEAWDRGLDEGKKNPHSPPSEGSGEVFGILLGIRNRD